MFKSHLQAVNWCDVLHMVTLCLNENKLMANEKGFCKTLEETYWIVAPPSGRVGQLTEPQKLKWKSTGALRRSDTSYKERWNKMISSKLSGIAAEKEVTVTYHERGSLGSPLRLFLTGIRDQLSQQTLPYIIIIIIINIIIIIIKWRRLLWYLTYRSSNTV